MSGVKGRSGRKGSYGYQLSKALRKIDIRLPELIDKLIERAMDGDREALVYLVDRRLGKPVQQTDMNLQGGEQLTAGLVTQLFTMLAARKRELEQGPESAYPLIESTGGDNGREEETEA